MMEHDAMSETSLVSVRISPELAERLSALAQTTHRSKSFLAAQAIEEFVNVQEWHMKAIREGIAAVERGEVASHDQAVALLKSWGKHVKG